VGRSQVKVDFIRGSARPWVACDAYVALEACETYEELRAALRARGVTSYTSTDDAFDEIETICA